jgi:hypothetical protein
MFTTIPVLLVLALGQPMPNPEGLRQQATFTAGTEFVTFAVRVFKKGTPKTPRQGLALDDFILKIDGKTRPLARVEVVDAGLPTQAYLLAYAPAPADRDGRSHTMEAQVKGIGKVVKRTFRIDKR